MMSQTRAARAVIVRQTGGPEVMQWEDVALPALGDLDVMIEHKAVGLNFIDIYNRTGLYPQKTPFGLGTEASGIVLGVGKKVQHLAEGDRVVYCTGPLGAYATKRVMPSSYVVKIPPAIDFNTAAAMMLKGLTAQYLIRQTHVVKEGDWILVHSAAGGVGLILTQWAAQLGAHVIGIVGSDSKAIWASANGCSHVIVGQDNFHDKVRDITGGRGVDVVYDSVGKDTFHHSLSCLRARGLMVSYGNASGAVEPFSPSLLAQKGSLYLTRPTLFGYAVDYPSLKAMSDELFKVVGQKKVQIHLKQTFKFSEVVQAHTQLSARQTVGSSVLIPD